MRKSPFLLLFLTGFAFAIVCVTAYRAYNPWRFSVYGMNLNTKINGISQSFDGRRITLTSLRQAKNAKNSYNEGFFSKQEDDTFIISHRTVDARDNFLLEADVRPLYWSTSFKKIAFGLTVTDVVPERQTRFSRNNSISAALMKIDYTFDGKQAFPSEKNNVSLFLGAGARLKTGANKKEAYYRVRTYPLDESASSMPFGKNYNRVANQHERSYQNLTDLSPQKSFHLSLRRDNNGYLLTYRDDKGHIVGQKAFEDRNRTVLTQLDDNHVHVGFFLAGTGIIAFDNIVFKTFPATKDTFVAAPLPQTVQHTDLTENDATPPQRHFQNSVLFVAPNGTVTGNGTRKSPLDIVSAIAGVSPGQIVVLTEGTYPLTTPLTLAKKGSSPNHRVYLVGDPDATTRPVLNFMKKCAGVRLTGNYWYLAGFDVTETKDTEPGIAVTGNHNVLDNLKTYNNGNTGIEIRQQLETPLEKHPSFNTVLNSQSFQNADLRNEDADGFAAKIVIGEGNVFDGCVAYLNADDGFDLYNKQEAGPMPPVVIKNSIAFLNGYNLSPDGVLISAGNGVGFKAGGEYVPVAHRIENSLAVSNRYMGFHSNKNSNAIFSRITFFEQKKPVERELFFFKNALYLDGDGCFESRKKRMRIHDENAYVCSMDLKRFPTKTVAEYIELFTKETVDPVALFGIRDPKAIKTGADIQRTPSLDIRALLKNVK